MVKRKEKSAKQVMRDSASTLSLSVLVNSCSIRSDDMIMVALIVNVAFSNGLLFQNHSTTTYQLDVTSNKA